MATSTPSSPAISPGASYDETPYPSAPFAQTHPDKLCAMARLFGLNAPDPATARVLELGCADGTNLLPMAQHAPLAKFVGIDASAKQVAAAHAAVQGARIPNVDIRHQDITEFPASEGKFDYIIAHGIYSWVPEEVRAKILSICSEHLNENGVAYVSYNAFPGWGMRMALRDMMLFHTGNLSDPKAKVQQARALTAFLSEAVPTESNPYGLLLKQELERMKGSSDNYLRHDILEEINQPFYFHQFAQRATRAGLQYLGEPSLDQMLASNLSPKTAETLKKVGSNIIAQEQYMDFVRNRNFRQTLLCHRGASLTRKVALERLKQFYFSSRIVKATPGTLDLTLGVSHEFKVVGKDTKLTTENPFVKAVFDVLAECSVNRLSFSELLTAALERSAPFRANQALPVAQVEEAALLKNLMQLYSRGIIDIYAGRPELNLVPPARPAATPLARYQAARARFVTTRHHQGVELDILLRNILGLCDGQLDEPGIVEALIARAKEGKLQIMESGKLMDDDARVRAVLENRVKLALPKFAASGLF